MGKVFMFNLVTLDGYIAGPDGNIDWHGYDAEHNDFGIAQLADVKTFVFGRVTYELMAGYWPTPAASQDDAVIADIMNNTPKVVFSRTLSTVAWQNTRLVKTDAVAAFAPLKAQPGDVAIFGSANLCATLSKHRLIDEYRIIINPLVLGSGIPLFGGVTERLNFKLLHSRVFKNGNVLLVYAPVD